MANREACTVNGQLSGSYSYNSSYSMSTAAYAGYNGASHYATIIKFRTPEFTGFVSSIVFSLIFSIGVGNAPKLRYALCSSDANKSSYLNTTAAVTDSNQIAAGTIDYTGITSAAAAHNLTVNAPGLKANTEYYLVLWSYGDTGISLQPASSEYGNLSVSINVESGLVYIDDGTGFSAYEVYIDNGSSWDRYIPYIDNGSGWDMCG